MSEQSETRDELDSFTHYVTELKHGMKRQYDRNINKDLSSQNWNDLFKRNVVAVLQQAYQDSLLQLQKASVPPDKMQQQGFSALAIQALQAFDGMIDDMLQYALQKHRTSCALSNFPEEHRPSDDYIVEVIQETNRDWQLFAAQVNHLLTAELILNAGDTDLFRRGRRK
ncbi:hypothetical protein [Kaarinaea lacus]